MEYKKCNCKNLNSGGGGTETSASSEPQADSPERPSSRSRERSSESEGQSGDRDDGLPVFPKLRAGDGSKREDGAPSTTGPSSDDTA